MNVTSLRFPYGETTATFFGCAPATPPNAQLTAWLLAKGSLTKKLKTYCRQFDVKVLGEGLDSSTYQHSHEPVWIREVLLCLDSVPWIFASTLIPDSLMSKRRAEFLTLGSRPLGELLFSKDVFLPGNIEIVSILPDSPIALLANSLSQPVQHSLWGRRRCFHHGKDKMSVNEVFFPAAEQAIMQMN